MPKLIRLYIRNVLIGFGLSAIFVGVLLWLNIGNLWHLISTSDVGLIAVIMLFMFNGIVFASVQFAWVVMHLGRDENRSGGRPVRVDMTTPVPKKSEARR